MPVADEPMYLKPYLSAARQYGSGFGSLLWASPRTQAVRFGALLGFVDVSDKHLLDVGCGRADLLEYLLARARYPRFYSGLEAVDALADAAEKKRLRNCKIIRGDFVSNPELLSVGADVLLISGALNTMDRDCFYASLKSAIEAANEAVVFNFLCSPYLAGASHLTWHLPEDVLAFCRLQAPRVHWRNDYLPGDATVCVWKENS